MSKPITNLPKAPVNKPSAWWYTLTIPIAFPFIIVGCVLCVLIFTIPIGIGLMILGSLPTWYVTSKRLAWELRDQPLQPGLNGQPVQKPWE